MFSLMNIAVFTDPSYLKGMSCILCGWGYHNIVTEEHISQNFVIKTAKIRKHIQITCRIFSIYAIKVNFIFCQQ